MSEFERTAEGFNQGFEELQKRYSGALDVIESTEATRTYLDVGEASHGEEAFGFRDISGTASEISAFEGRIVLYPDTKGGFYKPATITKSKGELQLTVLDQPFDPNVGVTDGIMFGLGLKAETSKPTFGGHTAAGGFEAGHFAPVMIGAVATDVRSDIIARGDKATHSTGNDVGGVPEKMTQTGLLKGVKPTTVSLDTSNPRKIPLRWHPSLESDEGMLLAEYSGTNPVKLMLGSAAIGLGPHGVDKAGELVNDAVRGA